MPYIKSEVRRHAIDMGDIPRTFGELNYMFYRQFLRMWLKTTSYDTVHVIEKMIGRNLILDSLIQWDLADVGFEWGLDDLCTAAKRALKEFDRRVVAEYEDRKIQENGDIVY